MALHLYRFFAVALLLALQNTKPTTVGPQVIVETVERQVHDFLALLPNFVICAVFLLFVWVFAFGSKRFMLSAGRKSHTNPPLTRALSRLISVLVWVLGLLTAATIVIPTFNPGSMIAGLGISSIAIGFAFKDIFQNFLAGLLLLWSQPFHVGDEIKSGDYEGTVEDIDIRATLIRTYSGERAIVPNSSVYTNAIIVKTAFPARRGKIEIAVDDPRPAEQVREFLEKLIRETPGVLADPAPSVTISSAKGSNMRFIGYLWSKHPADAQDEIFKVVRNSFDPAKSEVSAG